MSMYSIHTVIPNETYLIMTVNAMSLNLCVLFKHNVVFKHYCIFVTFHGAIIIKVFTVLYEMLVSLYISLI